MSDANILAAIANLGSTLGDQMTALDDRMASFDDRLTGLDDRMASFDDRLTALETGQKSLRVDLMARMDRLQDGLTAARNESFVSEGAADSIRRTIQNVREELADTNDNVFRLSRKLNRIETDVREMKGGA